MVMAYQFYDDCFQAGGLVQGEHLINIYVAKEEDLSPSHSYANPNFQSSVWTHLSVIALTSSRCSVY